MIHQIISEIKDHLHNTFSEVDCWFDKSAELQSYRPLNGGWTVEQILEHTGLTNYFLLILIEKGTRKALQAAEKQDVNEALKDYAFRRDKLEEVALHRSFEWMRPEHMEPKGEKSLAEVRQQLKEQLKACMDYLEKLKNGEGLLYKTQMSVNNLGKIDVYEYIYFLAQHAQRHLVQMKRNEEEFFMSSKTK
jgi:hypothetical protein